jgi:hypothetical protein
MESPPQPTVPDSPQIDYLCKAYRQQLPVWELLDAIYAGDRAWLDYKADGTISPLLHPHRLRGIPPNPPPTFFINPDAKFFPF